MHVVGTDASLVSVRLGKSVRNRNCVTVWRSMVFFGLSSSFLAVVTVTDRLLIGYYEAHIHQMSVLRDSLP